MASNQRKSVQRLDGGYAWVILAAATMVSFFQLGLVKVFGVFIPELVDQLDMSASAVGLSCSIGIGLRAILGPIWAALTRITSYRKLIMIGGAISSLGLIFVSISRSAIHLGCSMAILSIGSGIPFVAKVVVIKDYFQAKFSLANGIAFTGGAVGMTVLAPIMEFLIEIYGWRGAMLIYGAMNFNLCVGGALMIQPYKPLESTSETDLNEIKDSNLQTDGTDQKALYLNVLKRCKNYSGFYVLTQYRILIVYMSAMALHELVLCGWVLFLVSYTISSGFSAQIASFLSALGGGGALIGRLVLGPFIDKGLISGRMMFFFLAVGGAVTMFCYPFVDIYWILALISLMAGLFLGSTTPIYIVMLKEIVHDDSAGFASAVGLHYMIRGIGILAGGPLMGWLYDIAGNFYFAFMTLAAFETTAAIIVIVLGPSLLKRCRCVKHTQLDVMSNDPPDESKYCQVKV